MASRESQRLGKYEREKKTKFETFNDGVCRIYKLENTVGHLDVMGRIHYKILFGTVRVKPQLLN